MKDRLSQFLKNEELTAVKFAEIMEVQPSSISHLLAGRNKPNFDFISRMLLRFPDLNPDWLINGLGDFYKSKPTTTKGDITDVTDRQVTNVIESDRENADVNIHDVNTGVFAGNQEFNFATDTLDSRVTDVNSLPDVPSVNSTKESNDHPEKELSRVILFFSDGSFKEYRK